MLQEIQKVFLFFCLVTLCCLPNKLFSQYNSKDSLSFTLLKKIHGSFYYLKCDRNGNIYAITTSGRLIKYNQAGDSVAAFNDAVRLGAPSQLDVSNPMRPLLFYNKYSTLIVLDQILTKRYAADFRKNGWIQTTTVCNSYDNNIWIYDNFKVLKVDENLTLLNETSDLRTIAASTPEPAYFNENGSKLVLYDSSKGFFIFDLYGGFQKNIKLSGWNFVGGSNDLLWGIEKGYLKFISLLQHEDLQTIPQFQLPDNIARAKFICINNNKLFLINENGLETYQFNLLPKK